MAELRILGPLELVDEHGTVQLGGEKPRRLLGALALHADEIIPADQLIDIVWGESPPRSARANLLTYVWSLRRCMAGGRAMADGLSIEAKAPGYRLLAGKDELDWNKFTAIVAAARELTDDPHQAGDMLRDALGLWRGRPIADVADGLAQLHGRIAALEEARLAAHVQRIEADLKAGRHGELTAELAELVQAHPLHEQLRAQQMLSLYRSGRQADALHAFQLLRIQLRDELGIDPGQDLCQLYAAILRGEPALAPLLTARARPVPRQLPAQAGGFTGRAGELRALDELAAGTGGVGTGGAGAGRAGTGGSGIALITGPPGVGKTALAVHWARHAQDRYPDGTLFADLRGHDPGGTPREPAEVLAVLLRTLGTPAEGIPASEPGRAELLRALLNARRLLLVLDNAAAPAQVRPLIPGSFGCMVVITSRSRLTGLIVREGAAPVPLQPLPELDAVALLRHSLRQRVDAEPAAAADVARQCDGLPLALRIAAERAVARPELGMAELAGQLRQGRLDLLAAQDDESVAVRSVFAWSYRGLPPASARMFRLLGLHAGPQVSVQAAAALAGVGAGRARQLLDSLAGVHLAQEAPGGRFRLHDLLRLYAAELAAETDEVAPATTRMLGWYLHNAEAADRILVPHRRHLALGPAPGPPPFAGYDQALAWCDAERGSLLAAVRLAADAGEHTVAWQLSAALWGYFNLRGGWDDCVACCEIGLVSARAVGDQAGEAQLLTTLGSAYSEMGEPERTIFVCEQALAIRRELCDLTGAGLCLGHIANSHLMLGRFREAARYSGEALGTFQALGEPFLVGVALDTLGEAHAGLGRTRDATGCFEQALGIFGKLGDQLYCAAVAFHLGRLRHGLGESGEALRWYEQALDIQRELGDVNGQAEILQWLGDLHAQAGRGGAAERAWSEAFGTYTALGDRRADGLRDRLVGGL